MRISFLILSVLFAFPGMVFAQTSSGAFNVAGAGVFVSTSPYDDVKHRVMPVPFLALEYKDFYIKGIEAGYHFLKNGPWTLSVISQPRFMGYSSEDSIALNGMEDRKMSFDAGGKAVYALPWEEMKVTAKVLTDTLSRYDGREYELSLGRGLKGRIFRLMPSVGVRYQDKQMADYYYGVKGDEVRSGRSAYASRGALNPFTSLAFTCGVAKRLIVMGMLGVEFLGKDIQKSPIVDKNYTVTAGAGLTYRF